MSSSLETAETVEIQDADASFRIAYDRENIYMELDGSKDSFFAFSFEFTPTIPGPELVCDSGRFFLSSTAFHGYFGGKAEKELAKYNCEFISGERDLYKITISRKEVGWTSDTPLKLRICNNGILWIKAENPVSFLHIYRSPDEFGWLMP